MEKLCISRYADERKYFSSFILFLCNIFSYNYLMLMFSSQHRRYFPMRSRVAFVFRVTIYDAFPLCCDWTRTPPSLPASHFPPRSKKKRSRGNFVSTFSCISLMRASMDMAQTGVLHFWVNICRLGSIIRSSIAALCPRCILCLLDANSTLFERVECNSQRSSQCPIHAMSICSIVWMMCTTCVLYTQHTFFPYTKKKTGKTILFAFYYIRGLGQKRCLCLRGETNYWRRKRRTGFRCSLSKYIYSAWTNTYFELFYIYIYTLGMGSFVYLWWWWWMLWGHHVPCCALGIHGDMKMHIQRVYKESARKNAFNEKLWGSVGCNVRLLGRLWRMDKTMV